MRSARWARGGALAASLGLILGGCTITKSIGGGSSSTPGAVVASSQTVPPGQEALARFYSQKLEWTDCGSGAKCASLTVPIDYDHPEGATTTINVLNKPARSSRARIGSLLVNPGGPGGSGIEYAKAADFIVGAPVRKAYDIVGFDPRGVASSHPIECVDPAQLDAWLAQDPTPDDAAEEKQAAAIATAFGKACQDHASPLVAHVSTVEVAKDMDILRAALGDAKLTYLGKSYGTFLGATYADLFPTHVGRMVLDGALAPDLTPAEMLEGQAVGFETATRAWAQDCVDSGSCPLGSSADAVMTALGALFTRLDATPARVEGDARVTRLTEGWAVYGVASAMYDQGMWDSLTRALKPLVSDNDGTALMGLADVYADRDSDGRYSGNMMQALPAVNCLDAADSPDLSVYEKRAADTAVLAPVFGRFLGWSGLTCGMWPIPATGAPHRITAPTAPPIVVVGTTRDPATPYDWAVRLANQLERGALVSYDGDGHTAYTRSNSCVDDAIDRYYVDGTVPPDGLRC
jgi:pimeloyl-ACP methyl ester carboxylesterase